MSEWEQHGCPCSNISIMQLFHELKQKFPTVPDQIVSKVIQQNFHEKNACMTVLQRESKNYVQSYPGSLITGAGAGNCGNSTSQLCDRCTVSDVTVTGSTPHQSDVTAAATQHPQDNDNITATDNVTRSVMSRQHLTDTPIRELIKEAQLVSAKREECLINNNNVEQCSESSVDTLQVNVDTSDDDETVPRSRSPIDNEITHSLNVEENGNGVFSVSSANVTNEATTTRQHRSNEQSKSQNYQVAVQCKVEPVPATIWSHPGISGLCSATNQPRSFTSVNLTLRQPSSEPQLPIEIKSGQSLTYSTSSFDPRQGYQSQLQISIGPGGGNTISACRTIVSSPIHYTSSSSRIPHIHTCCNKLLHDRHQKKGSTVTQATSTSRLKSTSYKHELMIVTAGLILFTLMLTALIEKQKERKDLLAKELKREKEKLRCMQNEVKAMQAELSRQPSPFLLTLPKLKAEIIRLRAECERLTSAVDLYSDSQHNLPLGETSEEFYRNIYTGQQIRREVGWSCEQCTFRNHPLLSVCEECEMPRLTLGTTAPSAASVLSNIYNNNNNNSTYCGGAGTSTSASLTTVPLPEL